MSTSPKRAPTTKTAAHLPSIQPFPYDPIPAAAGARRVGLEGLGEETFGRSAESVRTEESRAREAEARATGREEGMAEAGRRFEQQLTTERASMVTALAQFTRDRAAYFQRIESEVVQLALSIARKILHREAQLDPLLLAGMVRVALESIDGATGVLLRVHPQNAADWRQYLRTHLDPADLPEIVEDAVQAIDSCIIETSMGTAVVGLEAQFKEIEQGLMDLLRARPGVIS